MTKRLFLWLGIMLLISLAIPLLVPGWRVTLLGVFDPPKTPPPARAEVAHPLDPLSKEELAAAVAVLKDEGKLPAGALFPVLVLNEPPKAEVLGFQPGKAAQREAFAVVLDRAANKTYEAVVDLKARKTASWKEVPGVQPAVLIEEFRSAAEIVRADPGWRAALRKRGIADKELDKVRLDVWAAGSPPPPGGGKGARLLRVLSFYRGEVENPYGRPIEGVVATVNMNTRKVIHLIDRGAVPTPGGSGDLFDPTFLGPLREPPKPLVISQPRGRSFEIRGHEVHWQKWRFRYALHPRERVS